MSRSPESLDFTGFLELAFVELRCTEMQSESPSITQNVIQNVIPNVIPFNSGRGRKMLKDLALSDRRTMFGWSLKV